MRTCSVLEIALLVGAMGSPVAAVEILVRPDGTGDYRHIAAAAGQALDGDVIVLTDGVFSGYGNRQASLLNKSVTLRSQSGNPADCIIEVENNGYWFLGGSVAEGITFRGGRIGLRLEENASVRNCVFEESTFGSIYARENTGTIEDTIVRNGGMHAILCEEGNMLITGCTVESNSNPTTNYQAPVGVNGGVATIENCRIVGNRGSKLAGGVSATNWSNVTLRGCTITGNTSPLHAGGVWSGTHSTMTIENCTIVW